MECRGKEKVQCRRSENMTTDSVDEWHVYAKLDIPFEK